MDDDDDDDTIGAAVVGKTGAPPATGGTPKQKVQIHVGEEE